MMRKRLNDIFSVSRNERIGIICILLIIAIILAVKAFTPDKTVPEPSATAAEAELRTAVESAKIDTLPRKTRKRKTPKKESNRVLTASSLEKVDTSD